MSERLEQPPSTESWKQRGGSEKSYRARRITHEANTSIEYGEKTWTTAQTVRDLMQNHLDAETERYYQQVGATLFGEDGLKRYFDPQSNAEERKQAEKLLHAAFMFAKYAEDMTPEARQLSEKHLTNLSSVLVVDGALQQENALAPQRFLEAVGMLSEERPRVSYEVTDTESGASVGWVAYETLRDEPLYQKKNKNGFRYVIAGMKIVDHGSGFDSQLSALYLSSKTGKRHLRGKFGEGAKMSELHLLRNGASLKMRSRYTVTGEDATEQSRVWQARPRVEGGRLVSRGVEVEQESEEPTGSTVVISLRKANEAFRTDFVDNVDPRLKGLEKNIADFSAQGFSYPMPITEQHLSGVDVSGQGEVQYVQGLRVELAGDSFGYQKPWFSYNFLDSSLIAGRDRNEINAGITDRIRGFWKRVDDPELLERLVRTAVKDTKRNPDENVVSSIELAVLDEILSADLRSHRPFPPEQVQKHVDEALMRELGLEKGVHTLVIAARHRNDKTFRRVLSYAREQGYEIKTTAGTLGSMSIERFAKRLPEGYTVVSLNDLEEPMHELPEEIEKNVEGAREKAIRELFPRAVASVNELVVEAGMRPMTFELEFKTPQKVNLHRAMDPYGGGLLDDDDEYDDPSQFYEQSFSMRSDSERPPIALAWADHADYTARIDPERLSDPRRTDPRAIQRKIELYLLAAFTRERGGDSESMLKGSQQLLDELITKLIPENAKLLKAIPKQFEYAKDPAVVSRLIDSLYSETDAKLDTAKERYGIYRKALDAGLAADEAQAMHHDLHGGDSYTVEKILESRVFLNGTTLTYYNAGRKAWEQQDLSKKSPIRTWRELPVYTLNDGRYFIPAPMREGAVLAKGEGKKREYTFLDGDAFLHIGEHAVEFGTYRTRYGEDVAVNPDGLVLQKLERHTREAGSHTDRIERGLAEYSYHATGTARREGSIEKRIAATAIPIEYGQDEWDNPVRIFQDVIQNHIDASRKGERVQLLYEILRSGERAVVDEGGLLPSDTITGITIRDGGSGYYPNDIATMGASSKKSPLFAGKYGEGQKMVAAAALRNGLELTYRSAVHSSTGMQSWAAHAISEARSVVLGGKEVEKKLVAFDITPTSERFVSGSSTTLRLPREASPDQEAQWKEWVSIIDPRRRDESGHGGLARHVRQLRQPGSERTYAVGSVSILLDEPGAVYENGLRINPQAEKGRSLSFGYDVPEVVTTRERNSYNPRRLEQYMRLAIGNIADPSVAEEILRKVADGEAATPDLDIGMIMHEVNPAAPTWAEVAQKVWPDQVVYSSEKIDSEISGEDEFYMPGDEPRMREQRERAELIRANMVHLDMSKVLDVPKESYFGFSKLLPTAESVIQRMETNVLPAPPAIKKALSEVVAESAKVLAEMLQRAKETLTAEQLRRFPFSEGRLSEWKDAAALELRNAVALAPITSAYHGKAGKGVIFNEALLIGGKRRDLAEVSLHEVAHIVSGYYDYQEDFVSLLYELAHHLAKQKAEKKDS